MSSSKIRAVAVTAPLVALLAACGQSGDAGQSDDTSAASGGECSSVSPKASHHLSTRSAANIGLESFKQELSETTEGRISVEIFTDSQLGGLAEMPQSLSTGAVQLAWIDSSSLSQFDAEFGVLDLPFLFEDMEGLNALLDGEFGEALNSKVEEVGVTPLYWTAVGPRDMYFVDKQVTEASDLKGLTMRVPEAPVWVDTFNALGASPTAIPAADLYTALDTGVVDGFEFPLGAAVDLKLYEPVSTWAPTGHIQTNMLLGASPSFMESLCDADRQALLDAAEVAKEDTRQAWKEENEKAAQTLEEELEVSESVDVDSFRKAVEPVREDFVAKHGSELFDLASQ